MNKFIRRVFADDDGESDTNGLVNWKLDGKFMNIPHWTRDEIM